MGTKWQQPPIFYVIAQICFNQNPTLGDLVKEIHAGFKEQGFADFKAGKHTNYNIAISENKEPEILQQSVDRWRFGNARRTESFLLQDNTLTFHTTAYETFEVLLERVTSGLQLVHEVVGLSFVESVGLRYLDAVVPDEGKSFIDYLRPGLHGPSVPNYAFERSYSERIYRVSPDTALISRMLTSHSGVMVTPDLRPMTLVIDHKFKNAQAPCATLDNDCVNQSTIEFDGQLPLKEITGLLERAKRVITESFLASVTVEAVERWQTGHVQ